MESSRQTRTIEDLRDKHKGQEIWVIGCGQSLDDFPDDFFDDKTSIAVNWAILAFPNCTYWHGHHEQFREYLRDEKPEFLPKSIILWPFPGPFAHGRITQPDEFFGELTFIPIWMRFRDIRPIRKSDFERAIGYIMEGRREFGYIGSMSVTHTAVEAAVVMGATRVTMVGCEHRRWVPGTRGYARKRGLTAYGTVTPIGRLKDPRVKAGTGWLAELLEARGIPLLRYYYHTTEHYEKGYQEIEHE